jgi:hypothetical protein
MIRANRQRIARYKYLGALRQKVRVAAVKTMDKQLIAN